MNPLIVPAIGGIIETVGKVADDLITSDDERNRAEIDAYEAETKRLGTQTKINEIEAASDDWFARRWRPAIGWVGVLAMLYQFVIYPFLTWGWQAMQAAGWISLGLLPPPQLDTDSLWVILTGLLGIGGMRSFDKLRK
jgi:hypothetical protein